ncbi:hypothetical protein DMN91_000544 [Ooceraea biroi]|uniref:Cytochrome P450 4C1 n=1 Tax=Ooceraea biroi TaxID=2015173 RepID=A0A3L8E1Y3_OOCBI|nr:hypothetical protein DMN91_000537 [Ooceraea biroi]RLU26747.1 hypothetical protein DMN91_000544 [Ooceraea biroi]
MVEESNHMTKSLKDMEDSTVQDLQSFFSYHTLNIICETSMGTSLQNIDVAEQERYRNAIHVLTEILFHKIVRLWYHSEIVFWFSSKYKEQVKCLKILHSFTEKIIAERKRYHESTGGRYLNFENTAEDNDMIGSTYI